MLGKLRFEPAVALLVLWAPITAGAMLLRGDPWPEATRQLVGSVLAFVSVASITLAPAVRDFHRTLPWPHRSVAGLVLAAILFGHLLGFRTCTVSSPATVAASTDRPRASASA